MKSINAKLVLSALGIALLATPAFAQQSQRHEHAQTQRYQDPAVSYPGGGNYFTPHYVPGFGNVDVGPSGE